MTPENVIEEYALPFATTGLTEHGLGQPISLGGRRYVLRGEGDDDRVSGTVEIELVGVQAYRVTFAPDVSAESIRRSHGRVVRLVGSTWAAASRAHDVHHFELYIDDGPLFEFLARSVVGRFTPGPRL